MASSRREASVDDVKLPPISQPHDPALDRPRSEPSLAAAASAAEQSRSDGASVARRRLRAAAKLARLGTEASLEHEPGGVPPHKWVRGEARKPAALQASTKPVPGVFALRHEARGVCLLYTSPSPRDS